MRQPQSFSKMTRSTISDRIDIRQVPLTRAVHWLKMGWSDLVRCGQLSLVQGMVMAAFGLGLIWLGHDRFWLLAGAFSGFMVVAPFLATSLYALSRAIEYKQAINKQVLLNTWLNWQHYRKSDPSAYWSVLRFGILLAWAATGWVVCSAALITLLAPGKVNTPIDFFQYIVLANHGLAFELWLTLGGVLAAPIYASSVIAIPLLLDRRVPLAVAVEVSWRCVLQNPGLMALWATVIMVLTCLGMVVVMMGLVVVIPLLGHASWHAYRDLVVSDGLPLHPVQS